MNNKKLFEEAIAEAKSIREAAIANAKEALEESLTPQIKNLLAQRLTEMEEEDSKELDEVEEVEEAKDEEAEEAGEEAEEAGEEAEEAGEEKEEAGEEAEDEMDIEDMSVEELKNLIRDIVGQMVDKDGDGDHDMDDHDLEGSEMGMEEPAGEDDQEEEIDLDELLAELSHDDEENPVMEEPIEEAMDPQTIEMIAAALGPLVIGGSAFAIDKAMNALKAGKAGSAGKALAGHLEKAGSVAGKSLRGEAKAFEAVKSELFEARKTVKTLTESLQEVNLLNAKLLFVNKVLKENKNLSNEQVANVIATFDKAKTSREAKLVYESFSTNFSRKSNAPVVESKLRGLASKAAGKAPVKTEVITEVSDAVKRMQKLAGIIKG